VEPSLDEGLLSNPEDQNNSLKPFQGLVFKLTKAQEWKVREIAANTFSGLINPKDLNNSLDMIVTSISEDSGSNDIHGSCLQIDSLLAVHLVHQKDFSDSDSYESLISILKRLSQILKTDRFSVGRSVYLQIINRYYKSLCLQETSSGLQLLESSVEISKSVLVGTLSSIYCPDYIFDHCWFIIILSVVLKNNLTVICDLLNFDSVSIRNIDNCFQNLLKLDKTVLKSLESLKGFSSLVEIASKTVTKTNINPTKICSSFEFMTATKFQTNLDIESHIRYWFDKKCLPFDFIAALLESITSLLLKNNQSELMKFYFEKCMKYTKTDYVIFN
jgi:hypothetical protein